MAEPSDEADRVERPPWWGWVFVSGVPLGVLALLNPWFAVGPAGSGPGTATVYHWWEFRKIGAVGPVFTVMLGWIWGRALLGRRALPDNPRWWWGNRGWGAARGFDVPVEDPVRMTCGISAAVGAVVLVLLWLEVGSLPGYRFTYGGLEPSRSVPLTATLELGARCALGAGLVFVAAGVLGVWGRTWAARRREAALPEIGDEA